MADAGHQGNANAEYYETSEAKSDEAWTSVIDAPDISDFVTRESEYPVASGAFGDIYRGNWNPRHRSLTGKNLRALLSSEYETKPVAIKVLRAAMADGPDRDKFKRRLNREIGIWQRLHHDNILPMIGVSRRFGTLPSPISPWQTNGTIKDFLERFPDANRWELLRGTAKGLSFLHGHTPEITYGDMKAGNLLINDWGGVYLSDFGISTVHDEMTFWKTATTSVNGTSRYMSPELLLGEAKPTRKSDVWAFGMTCLEIMTNRPPWYPQHPTDLSVIQALARGKRPERPLETVGITDELWAILLACWKEDPEERPEMRDTLDKLTVVCSSERPLRLLSIDGGGIRAICSLVMLRNILEKTPGGKSAKPCDYFDMIAGSGTGGVIALMLGRLKMTVDDCTSTMEEVFPSIFKADSGKQRKRLLEGRFRFKDDDLSKALRPIIESRLAKDQRGMLETDLTACRTFVTAEAEDPTPQSHQSRLRTYYTSKAEPFNHDIDVAMGATLCTPTSFECAWTEGISMEKFSNQDVILTNPSSALLREAQSTFGEHRRIASFISLGSGLAPGMVAPDSHMTDGLPEILCGNMEKTASAIEAVNVAVQQQVQSTDPGAYLRVDPGTYIAERLHAAPTWQLIYAWERTATLDYLKQMTNEYMMQEAVGQQAEEAASRLPPRGRRMEASA